MESKAGMSASKPALPTIEEIACMQVSDLLDLRAEVKRYLLARIPDI